MPPRVLLAFACLLCCSPFARAGEEPPRQAAGRPKEPLKPRNDLPGLRNFAQVSPVLCRGAQPTREGFAELKKRGVKTVVNLRWLHDDREALKGLGLRSVHIRCQAWNPREEDVAAFLHVVRDPANQPVFVHCQHGADRTGMMVAVYRMAEQGWANEDAAKEVANFGFHKVWTRIADYLRHFDREKLDALMRKTRAPKVDSLSRRGPGSDRRLHGDGRRTGDDWTRGRVWPAWALPSGPALPGPKAESRTGFVPCSAGRSRWKLLPTWAGRTCGWPGRPTTWRRWSGSTATASAWKCSTSSRTTTASTA
jgi:protein tyrosine phosphatase (PTP) superfamily phosphohydrolase (DUF442 family)